MLANSNAALLRGRLRGGVVAFSFLMMACAGAQRSLDADFTREVLSSRDGSIRYRLPVGWTDATSDAPSGGNLIWLVRNDDSALLFVRKVTVDELTRKDITDQGLLRLGELTLSMESSENGVSVVRSPSRLALGTMSACEYEYRGGHSGDRVHVILVDTGMNVYEIHARMGDTTGEEEWENTISLQQGFVCTCVW